MAEAEAEPETLAEAFPESEPEPEAEFSDSVARNSFITAYSICILAIVLLNIHLLIGLCKVRPLETTARFLVCVLLASVCVGVLVVPSGILGFVSHDGVPDWICMVCEFFAHVATGVSIWAQMSLAVTRVLVIGLERPLSNRVVAMWISLIWLVSAIYACRAAALYSIVTTRFTTLDEFGNSTVSAFSTCTVDKRVPDKRQAFSVVLVLDNILIFVLPACMIAFSYGWLFRKLHKKVKSRKEENDQKKFKSMMKLFLCLLVVFLCCQSPLQVFRVISHFCIFESDWVVTCDHCFKLLAFSNAILNPVLILAFRSDLRALPGFCCKTRVVEINAN